MNKVLVLGAGMVVRAHVRYLLGHNLKVTVASLIGEQAEEMVDGHPNGSAVQLDIRNEQERLGYLARAVTI